MRIFHSDARIIAAAVVASHVISVSAPAQLVGNWDMDTQVGTHVADLVSTSGNNGVIGSDAVRVTTGGPFGASPVYYDFTGASGSGNNKINMGFGSALDLSGDYSISAWVQANNPGGGNSTVVSRYNGGSNQGYALRVENGARARYFHLSSVFADNFDPSTIGTDSSWHHAVATFEVGVGTKLYVDKVQVASSAASTTAITDFSLPFYVGAQSGTARSFQEGIDEVQIFASVLSAAEVTNLFDNNAVSAAAAGSLAGKWDFDTLSGANVDDLADRGNPGAVVANVSRQTTGGPIAKSPAYYNFTADNADRISAGSGSELDVTGSYTLSAWFQGWNVGGGNSVIAGRYDDGFNHGFALRLSSGAQVQFFHFNGGFNNVTSASVGTGNDWHHAVAVFEVGVGSELFVDGVSAGTASTTTSGIGSHTLDFWIGNQDHSGFPRPFGAGIDEVALWSENLTDGEVKGLYDLGLDSTLGYGSQDFDSLKQVHDAGSGSTSGISGASGPDLFWTFAGGLGSTEGLSGSSPSFTLVLNGSAGTGLTSSSGAVAGGTVIIIK